MPEKASIPKLLVRTFYGPAQYRFRPMATEIKPRVLDCLLKMPSLGRSGEIHPPQPAQSNMMSTSPPPVSPAQQPTENPADARKSVTKSSIVAISPEPGVSSNLKNALPVCSQFPGMCQVLGGRLSDYLDPETEKKLAEIVYRSRSVPSDTTLLSSASVASSEVLEECRRMHDFLIVLLEGLQT